MPDPTDSETQPRKYWAFISYSQRDKEWSGWLQRAIETYRVPRRLVGRPSRDGAVPRRLFPVFRDREELPTSADLGSNIEEALRASRYLIVVCSSNAALSRWVNEEVRGFKAMGREDRVLAIIVDGEPNASDKPDAVVPECFPPALRYRVGSDGALTQERTEPIAADARPDRDGRSNAQLKILAGLLGVGFDELRQRERTRRQRRAAWMAAAGAVIVGALVGIWFVQERAKRREVDSELASKYEERARQLVENGDTAGAAVFFAAANKLEPTRIRRDAALLHIQHLVLPSLAVDHGGKINSVAFDPGGNRFLAMTEYGPLRSNGEPGPGRLRVWDAASGKGLLEFPIDHGAMLRKRRAFFTRDGKRIFTAVGNARLWDSQSGQPIAPIIPFQNLGADRDPTTVEYASLDPTEQKVVLKWTEDLVQSWDAETSQPLGEPKPHAGALSELAFLWDDDRIPLFSPDRKTSFRRPDLIGPLQVLDATTGEEIGHPLQQEADIEAAAFSPNGRDIVTGSANGAAYLWHMSGGPEILRSDRAMKHPASVSIAKFSSDGGLVLTISGNTARVWNRLAELEMVMPTPGHVGAAAFSADGQSVVTGSEDGSALVWKVPSRRFLPREISRKDWQQMHGGTLSPKGNTLFAQHYSPEPESRLPTEPIPRCIQLWDIRTGAPLWGPVMHQDEIISATFSPDGSVIATIDHGLDPSTGYAPRKTLRFWNAGTGAAIGRPSEIPGDNRGDSEIPETVMAFAADSSRLLLVSNESIQKGQPGSGLTARATLKMFDARSGEPVAAVLTLPRYVPGALFLRSDDILLAGGDQVVRWPTGAAQPSTEPFVQMKRVLAIAVTPDENTLLTISRDDGRLWDLKSRQPIGRVLEKRALTEQHTATFTPTGRLAITVDGRVVRVWDARTGEAVGEPFLLGDNRLLGPTLRYVEGHLLAVGRDGIWDKDISWLLRDISPRSLLSEAELFSRQRVGVGGVLESIPAAEWAAMAGKQNAPMR